MATIKAQNKYQNLIDAIDPISVRPLAVSIVAPHTNHEQWNWIQAAALFDHVRTNIKGVLDPLGFNYVASPLETIKTGGGDCEDKAILLASMCIAVGIPTRLVVCLSTNNIGHCLAEINFGKKIAEKNVADKLGEYYNNRFGLLTCSWEVDERGDCWILADAALCQYIGDRENLIHNGYINLQNSGWTWTNPIDRLYPSQIK